jgi:hypothetical protein
MGALEEGYPRKVIQAQGRSSRLREGHLGKTALPESVFYELYLTPSVQGHQCKSPSLQNEESPPSRSL